MGVVALNVRRIIRERGLRQGYLAEKAGFPSKQFNALLTGRKIMREEHILAIALALEVTPSDLFKDTA